MSTSAISSSQSRFKIGWLILLSLAALLTLGHFFSIFFLNEPTLFTFFAASNLYAFLVIFIPFRRFEKWAWWATWILPVILLVTAALVPSVTLYYFPIAVVCVLDLLLTMRDFFANTR